MLVKLEYFKVDGKYYSGGEYYTEFEHLHEIFKEVKRAAMSGNLPGLAKGNYNFHILINTPDHQYNHPHLIPQHTYV